MAWIRIETELFRHEKLMAVPDVDRAPALALYIGILSYCSELLTDGQISRTVALGIAEELGLEGRRSRRASGAKLLTKLCSVGLLEVESRHSLRVHDYTEHQQTRAQVFENRAKERAKKRAQRGSGSQTALDVPELVPKGQREGRPQGTPEGTKGGTPARMRASADADADTTTSTSSGSKDPAAHANLPNGLPFAKEHLVLRLLQAIGEEADADTPDVVRSYAARLPEGALAKVLESVTNASPASPVRYTVGALKRELDEQDPEPDFEGEEP